MTKSKKSKRKQVRRLEKLEKKTSANSNVAVNPGSSSTESQNQTSEDTKKDAVVLSSAKVMEEPSNDVAHLGDPVETQSVQPQEVVQMVETSSQVESTQYVVTKTSTTKKERVLVMNGVEKELLQKIRYMEQRESLLIGKIRQLQRQNKQQVEQNEIEQNTVSTLTSLLEKHCNWYFALQRQNITDHINICKKMLTDISDFADYVSSSNNTKLLESCCDNFDEWNLELHNAEWCWFLFKKYQQNFLEYFNHRHLSGLSELPNFLTGMTKPTDVLHDSLVFIATRDSKECQTTDSSISNNWWKTKGTNQQPDFAKALGLSDINTNKEQAADASTSSEFKSDQITEKGKRSDRAWLAKIRHIHLNSPPDVQQSKQSNEKCMLPEVSSGEFSNIKSKINKEQGPCTSSAQEVKIEPTTQNLIRCDSNWLKNFCRIDANSPSDIEQDRQNIEKDVPPRFPSRVEDINICLNETFHTPAQPSDDRKQDISVEELHTFNSIHLDDRNVQDSQTDSSSCSIPLPKDEDGDEVFNTSFCSSASGYSDSTKYMGGPNFYHLFVHVKERIPQVHEVEVLKALKAVQTKQTRLSGMLKDDIVAAVQAELSSTKDEGCTAGACAKKISESEENCVICLMPYEDSTTVTMMCLHTFHANCLKLWLVQNPVCPICQQHVSPYEEAFGLLGDMESQSVP